MSARILSLAALLVLVAALLPLTALAPAAPDGKPSAKPTPAEPAETAKTEKDKQPAANPLPEYLPLLALAPHSGFPATVVWAGLPKLSEAKTAEEPEKKASPAETYIKVLKDANPLVRKRALLILMKMKSEARVAIPAFLEMSFSEDETESNANLAAAALDIFSTAEIIESLLTALKDSEQENSRRRLICRTLPALHKGKKTTAEEKASIYQGLEETVADDDPQLRLTAATALEIIDADVARAAGKKTTALTQTYHILLDPAFLKRLQVTPEQVQKAVQARYSRAKVVWSKAKTDLEVTVLADLEADWAAALGSIPIGRSGGGQAIMLREVATLEAGRAGQQ